MVEPRVKAYLALWLIGRGAREVAVSVDGAEPSPDRVREMLIAAGCVREAMSRSAVGWTGRYTATEGATISVVSRPGIDVMATFEGGTRWLIECKGEPTASGFKSGQDRTLFYTALGQLLMTAGLSHADHKLVAVPESVRLRLLAKEAVDHPILRTLGVGVLLVRSDGAVEEVG